MYSGTTIPREANEVRDPSGVESARDRLRCLVEQLSAAALGLHQRLAPLLRKGVPSEEVPEGDRTLLCPIANDLEVVGDDLQRQVEFLSSLLDACDI